MWPWSTIRSLRLELAQAEHSNESLQRRLSDSVDRERAANSQINTLTTKVVSFETSLKEAGRQADDLREQLAEKTKEATMWEERGDHAHQLHDAAKDREGRALIVIAELREQLAAASKNDQRDKRGRFTKAQPMGFAQ